MKVDVSLGAGRHIALLPVYIKGYTALVNNSVEKWAQS
jgi:hypothetical protein